MQHEKANGFPAMTLEPEIKKNGEEARPVPVRLATKREDALLSREGGKLIAHITREDFHDWPAELAQWRNDLQCLAHNLLFAKKDKTPCVIGFASAQPGEGTSTLAVATALLVAHNLSAAGEIFAHKHAQTSTNAKHDGRRETQALLIDTQLQHPSLHRLFGVDRASGVSELLREELVWLEALKDVPRSSLKLLTVGHTHAKSLHYYEIARFGELLRELKTQFEFIFLDLPPLLRGIEAAELSKLCDGVILIVQAHKTKREAVLAAQRVLEKAEVDVLGCVLNQRRFFVPDWLYQRL
ncbi:CpsD/CapB family tyrosine-protein kinase [candidate division KSB1 bacterium]|nr:CpsD/CapB family tyrosine-protein kinase [candidate division KSB1 bacterium]